MSVIPSAPPSARVVGTWSHEPNLDFLRTVAVLCVVVRHVLNMYSVRQLWWLNAQALGIFGVLMFFVHTSLVLMISIDRSGQAEGLPFSRYWAAFLVRRFFRIYPLSVTAVLLTYFLLVPAGDGSAALAGIAPAAGTKDLWANLLLVQDLTLKASVLAPLWSLPAEVQMYLILPVLFLIVRRQGARSIVWIVWPASVAIAVLSWKLDLRLTVARYTPCFVAGVASFGFLRERRSLAFLWMPVLVAALLVAYMAAYTRFGLQAGLGIGATFCLATIIPSVKPMNSTWARRVSQIVAKYSYGIYLFHVPCIWLAFGKLRSLGIVGSSLAFLLMVGMGSVISYHLIEEPFVRLGKRLATKVARGGSTVATSQMPAVSP